MGKTNKEAMLLRKAAAVVCSAAMAASMAPSAGFAQEVSQAEAAPQEGVQLNATGNIAEGDCGSCHWVIDADGCLTIGAGSLDDWHGDTSESTPWYSYRSSIKSAKMGGTVKAKTCCDLFRDCSKLVSVDLTGLDTSSVTDMSRMFFFCTSLTSVDLSGLDTSSVTDMESTFQHCSSLTSLDLSGLDTSNLTGVVRMFFNCSSLTSLDLSSFDTSKLTTIERMFEQCSKLSTISVGDKWSISSVIHYYGTFIGCTSLVGGAGTAYDESHKHGSYAHIDGGAANPGYLTYKQAPKVECSPFSDTPINAWYHQAVAYCKDSGLVSGYDNGTFGPDNTLTRAQAATILWNYYCAAEAASYGSKAANATGMPDVRSDMYYTAAANWAVANGVISGKDQADGSKLFDPDGVITREQLCTVVANASANFNKTSQPADMSTFYGMPDASGVSTWATESVAWALTNGVISGKEAGGQRVIDATGPVTRAEMAAVVMNSIENSLLK